MSSVSSCWTNNSLQQSPGNPFQYVWKKEEDNFLQKLKLREGFNETHGRKAMNAILDTLPQVGQTHRGLTLLSGLCLDLSNNIKTLQCELRTVAKDTDALLRITPTPTSTSTQVATGNAVSHPNSHIRMEDMQHWYDENADYSKHPHLLKMPWEIDITKLTPEGIEKAKAADDLVEKMVIFFLSLNLQHWAHLFSPCSFLAPLRPKPIYSAPNTTAISVTPAWKEDPRFFGTSTMR